MSCATHYVCVVGAAHPRQQLFEEYRAELRALPRHGSHRGCGRRRVLACAGFCELSDTMERLLLLKYCCLLHDSYYNARA